MNGWRLSGDVPLRVMQTCPLTVNLPNQQSIIVAAAIVRWVRGQEYGVETLVVEKQTQSRLEHLIKRLVRNTWRASVSDQRSKRDSMSIEESAISDMWEIAARGAIWSIWSFWLVCFGE